MQKNKAEKKNIKCSECDYCKGHLPRGNTRMEFGCLHPDQDYIIEYFKKKKIHKMSGFLGFGVRNSDQVPIRTSPAWCPKKKELC